MAKPASLPVAVVSLKGAQRLRRQNPWCYRTELLTPPDTREPGAVVWVVDPQKNPVGQAFYAQKSPLALRLLTRESPEKEPIDEAFFRRRLEGALKRRAWFAKRDAYRLVHGESDGIPGLFVDRYGKGLVLQSLSEGADARKESLGKMAAELVGASHVLCRDDGSGRDFEGLPREVKPLMGAAPFVFGFHEGENLFEVDLVADMKTGSFLDQLDNHVRAGELASGEGLDCFSYHGGFALALSTRCSSVLALEQDEKAAERARENARRNGRTNVTVEQANVFDVLHRFDREGRRFDTVVLDPPGLAKRKEGMKTALRAYRELNLRALKAVRPDGLLVTCSCSGKLTRQDFEDLVLSAAQDAKRSVQVLERRGAGMDHPVLGAVPESEYLKALFLRVL
jgi:23S rRNA (cytosine1962-C5)-methyltransferase